MVFVLSTETVPGWEVVGLIGLVYASSGAFGGMDGAIERLTGVAEKMGANAIVACRISGDSNGFIAYGTAVTVAQERDE